MTLDPSVKESFTKLYESLVDSHGLDGTISRLRELIQTCRCSKATMTGGNREQYLENIIEIIDTGLETCEALALVQSEKVLAEVQESLRGMAQK